MVAPQVVPVLHRDRGLYHTQHTISWLMLAFAAGATNAGAFLATNRFASHVTGTVTLIGVNFATPAPLVHYLLVFGAFLIGACVPVLFLGLTRKRNRSAPYWIPLALEFAVLVGVAILGKLGFLGVFSREHESALDFITLGLLGFAMGLQNSLVSLATEPLVRTTHLTGDTTDLAMELSTAWIEKGETRRISLRSAKLRFGKIAMFVVGAAFMTTISGSLAFLAFLLPAAAVAIAIVQSFVGRKS